MMRYIDMDPGITSLMGIRHCTLSENLFRNDGNRFCITLQYKGTGTITFWYNTEARRDAIYQKMREELLKMK